jgi:hypothetical protein
LEGEELVNGSNILKVDHEWVKLILEAKKLGIAKEEIRIFLGGHKANEIVIEEK